MKTYIIFFLTAMIMSFNASAFSGNVSAASAVLIEQTTGKVLYSKKQFEKMKPASTTKILTAITALENSKANEIVSVSKNAADTEGSSMYIEAGEKLTMGNLLYGLMMNSGNDAAVAIAEHISKNEAGFANLMNKTAKKAGVKHSNFTNPNGLDDDNHYTTAHDLAVITAYAMNNPVFKDIVKTKTKIIETTAGVKKYLSNHNKLLSMYKGCDGVKTGFTKASGRTLVSTAERDGMRLIAVTLKASDDWNDHIAMLNYGFDNYTVFTPVVKNQFLKKVFVKDGVKSSVELLAEDTLKYIIRKDEKDKFLVECESEEIQAPLKKGDVLGYAVVFSDGKEIGRVNLISNEDIEKIIIEKTYSQIVNVFFHCFLNL